MPPYVLSDADVAATELGAKRRAGITVAEATENHIADLFAEFAEARAAGRFDRMGEIRDHASTIDPSLVAELDGFDYPAAA
jgi:hypothetical protein